MHDLLNKTIKPVLQRALNHALTIQHPCGYWLGRLDSNSTMEAEYLFLLHFLNQNDLKMKRKIIHHILKNQREDGTWGLYHHGPGDLSTTVECYFALKLE